MRSNLRLVVFDLDGTLVECVSSWVYVHEHFGVSNEGSLREYQQGLIDDEEFMRRDIALWKRCKPGIGLEEIERILAGVQITEGAHALFHALRAAKVQTAIISGGLMPLARRVAGALGIDHVMANDLAVHSNGTLVGHGVLQVELHRKGLPMRRLMSRLKMTGEECAAVGNSYIDVPMLGMAGLGIAFCPLDDEVRRAADIVVEERDLSLLAPFLIDRNHGRR
ncbi:MAG: HAD-IB family phosphatase [Candidatus Thermoplasmatota archaeon]